MEVNESDWISKAIDNVDWYLNRGGELKGDEPQLLGGTNLLNTIGVAMGLPLRDPREWTQNELQRALNNELVYFEGDARKAIDVIANQIRSCCNGDDKNFITVLPIELYWRGKLYEIPVFRVQRYKDSKKYYVDNIGRSYDNFNDWFDNNSLPPCKMAYPYELTLVLRPGYNYSRVIVDDTPSARAGSKIAKGVDISTIAASVARFTSTLSLTGRSLAAPVCAVGMSTTGYNLINETSHGQNINPFTNSESRKLWLGIAENIVGFGALGATMTLTSLVRRGRNISNSFRILVNVMNGMNIVVSGAAMLNANIDLFTHYDEWSPVDVLRHVSSMAFWTKGLYTYKTAGTLIRNVQDHAFSVISSELQPEDAHDLNSLRAQFNDDAQLLREFHRASEKNIPGQTFSQILIDFASIHGNVNFDGAGNLLSGGQTYSFEFLSRLPRNLRRQK